MAVVKMATRERFIGLSTDTKPTSASVGSTFEETDTKDIYSCYDGTNWTKSKRNSETDIVADWRHNKNL